MSVLLGVQLPAEQAITGQATVVPPTLQQAKDNSAYLVGASTAVSAFGAIGSAWAQANAYEMQANFQRSMAELNEKFSDFQSDEALARSDRAVDKHRLEVRNLIGTQRANLGASGVEVNDGSAALLQEDAAYLGQLDSITIRTNALREAFGYKVAALKSNIQGDFAGIAGQSNINNTILTGGLNVVNSGLNAGAYISRK